LGKENDRNIIFSLAGNEVFTRTKEEQIKTETAERYSVGHLVYPKKTSKLPHQVLEREKNLEKVGLPPPEISPSQK